MRAGWPEHWDQWGSTYWSLEAGDKRQVSPLIRREPVLSSETDQWGERYSKGGILVLLVNIPRQESAGQKKREKKASVRPDSCVNHCELWNRLDQEKHWIIYTRVVADGIYTLHPVCGIQCVQLQINIWNCISFSFIGLRDPPRWSESAVPSSRVISGVLHNRITHSRSQLHVNIGRRCANVLALSKSTRARAFVAMPSAELARQVWPWDLSFVGRVLILVTDMFWSVQHAIDAMSAGVSPSRDTSYNSSYWDVGSAFFFAGTVITTIGIAFRYEMMDNSG